jgi:anti-sigma28 factor (negative regulator of flagellin synthesis)
MRPNSQGPPHGVPKRGRGDDEIDMDKVVRLRKLLASGRLGMDFDSLVERLMHAMRS